MEFELTHFSVYAVAYEEPVCPKDATCPIAQFSDTAVDFWWHDGIHFCLENGLMNGVGGSEFDPTGTTSRAMVATILWRIAGSPVVNYQISFTDVEDGKWYTEAIRWASAVGIITGYPDGTFQPAKDVTREELATILYRADAALGNDVSVDENTNFLSFEDFWDVNEYAKPAMTWALDRGVVQGKTGGVIDPQGTATRAETATMFMRFCGLAK